MKKLTNILSYLWLLLLLPVAACNDLEEEVGPMHVEEEVELNIQLHVPDMQASTRTAPTESITAITAYAFDSKSQLIKAVKAILSNQQATSGNLKIKVPKRTGDIHFVAKNNDDNPDVTISIGDNVSTLLDQTTENLHYWGKAEYNGGNELSEVTLTRNMAKLTLTLGEGLTGYIAGFVNCNLSGTIVPSGYTVGNTPTIPNDVSTNTHKADNSLGTEYYLFEHANTKDNPLYIILEILDKYYKVAFAAKDAYFPIVRNHGYNIHIEKIDEMFAETYENAISENTQPINALVIEEVELTVTPSVTELENTSNNTCTVIVTIPEGVTELTVDAGDAFTITPLNNLTTNSNGSYAVTTGEYKFTLKIKEGASSGNKTISFAGRGKYKRATGSTSIRLYQIENVTLPITPDAPTVGNTEGSTTQLTVQIPDGITSLSIDTDAFDITSNDVTLNNGSWDVSSKQGQSVTFTLELKDNGTAGNSKTVTFNGSGQYKRATGTATVTLQDNALSNVNLTVAVIDEDANNPSMIYGQNSEEDLYVKVTIPAGVTTLAFSSDYFDIASASDLVKEGDGGEAYLSGSGNSYTVNHQGEESITLPFRLRLKNNVQNTSASFTFTGSGETINNASATKNVTLQQRNPDDGSVYWEGYMPLNQADNTTKISIPKDKLSSAVNRVMRIECEKTHDNQALALLNNWNQFNPDKQYSTETIDVPLTQDFVNSINENLIITGRGAEGMLMKKVSFLQLQTVQITAALTPQITSLNYTTNENSVSELIVNVTIPAGVTTLEFSSDYFEVEFINSTSLTDNGNGSYTVTGNAQISADARLRLKNKTAAQNAGFTFSGTGEGVMVTPASVGNITLQANGDENVRWQGDVELSYDYDARKIVLPYSWFSSVPVDSKLRVEYDIISTDGPLIQFSEVKDTWDDPGFHFPELDVTTDDRTIGCNLSDRKSNGGYWIYGTNESAFTGSASFDLTLSQDVLTALAENRRPDLFGGEDIVIAIQGKNVRLKKISVIPAGEGGGSDNNNQLDMSLAFSTSNGVALDNMIFGISALNLNVTIPAEDAQTFDGQTVSLPVTLNGNGAEQAVNWRQSCINGTMTYNDNGYLSGLQFSIQQGVTNYSFKWIFIRTDDGSRGNVNIPIAVSDSQSNVLENVSVTIKNSSTMQGTLEDNSGDVWDAMIFNESFPIGTKIDINFSQDSTIKLCDTSNNALWVPSIMKDNSSNNGDASNPWVSISAGTLSITLNSDITLYEKGNSSNSKELLGNLNGFRIESGNTLPQTITVTAPASALNKPN